MKKLIIVFLFFVLSCASNKPVIHDYYKLSSESLETNDFKSAKEYAQKIVAISDKSKINAKIENSESCFNQIHNCDNLLDQYSDYKCKSAIMNFCRNELSKSLDVQREKLLRDIWDRKDNYTSKYDLNCEDGYKWVFKSYHHDNFIAYVSKVGVQSKYFENQLDCEEARIIDSKKRENSEKEYHKCEKVYSFEDKNLEYYSVNAVVIQNAESVNLKIKFATAEKCENAIKNGFDYYTEDGSLYSIKNDDSSKFIGSCEKNKVLICAKNEGNRSLNGLYLIN